MLREMFLRLPLLVILRLTLATAPASAQAVPEGPPAAPAPPPAAAEPKKVDAAPAFKISGLMYGDYYYVAANHRDELVDQNGFWFRRVYFTYDHTLSKTFSLRFRLEANSKGDFVSSDFNTPFLKDAYLKWSFGAHALTFGLQPTLNAAFLDDFQGYRSIEKSPFDFYRWDGSRDMGLSVQGQLGEQRRTSYGLQVGNGSGIGTEVNQNKTLRGQLLHRFASGLVLEASADWQDRPLGRRFATLEAFVGWQETKWRGSLQYGRQLRRFAGTDGADLTLDLLSAFAWVKLTPKLALLGRLDRLFDPIPNGEAIDYMPFFNKARAVFGYVALDVTVAKTVHLIPNLEWTRYDQAKDGTTPGSDLMPRVTLFFSW